MLIEEVVEIDLSDDPSTPKMAQFGKNLTIQELAQWVLELKKKIKVFTYAYQDMLGLDTSIVVHYFTLRLNGKLVKKKIQCIHHGKALLFKVELQNILDASFIKAISYTEWVSNLVIFPKPNG